MMEIDVKGLACPMPILRLRKALTSMQSGDEVRLIVTDKAALKDVPLFCQQTGHVLVSVEVQETEGVWVFTVQKQH
jgi:tRNA 2-thiouridine synthesizing protein A